jgi:tripeptidyl-peptidase I
MFPHFSVHPVVGTLLTLIDDARLTTGKNPLGFINPAVRPVSPSHPSTGIKTRSFCLNADLQQHLPERFNDTMMGGNQGCGTGGYTAVPGWDPTTRLWHPQPPIVVC